MIGGRNLVFVVAHLDDFEFSCLGYLLRKAHLYKSIKIITCSTWKDKESIWKNNLKKIEKHVIMDIESINLGFDQRTLTKNFDQMKDQVYQNINFNELFDIVTHDKQDVHSDHLSVFRAAFGIIKHSDRFVTFYSPSSYEFQPNYYVELSESEYILKHDLLTSYDFNKEQSYSKKGSYFRKEYTHIPSIYSMENFINREMPYGEIYKIYKWVEECV